jgi:uncharacterized protein YcfJ
MKKSLFLLLGVMVLAAGCETGPNTQRGAVIGGATGALLGGIIGHQSGRALEGAGIGAAAGAVGGGLLGNAADKEKRP